MIQHLMIVYNYHQLAVYFNITLCSIISKSLAFYYFLALLNFDSTVTVSVLGWRAYSERNETTIGRSSSICIFIIFSLVNSIWIRLILPFVTTNYSIPASPYPFPLPSTPPPVTWILSNYSYDIKFKVSSHNLAYGELKIKLKNSNSRFQTQELKLINTRTLI